MTTQMQLARQGVITEAMKIVAEQEHVTAEFIREGVANGTIAIPCNINHKNIIPRGVGTGLTVKVNANIGTSSSYPDPEPELASCRLQLMQVRILLWTFLPATISVLPVSNYCCIYRNGWHCADVSGNCRNH